MFRNREDAAEQMVKKFEGRDLKNPVVLGVPRGGIVPAAILAQILNADLDVLLARKIRAPFQPELAIGAIGEDGEVYFYHADLVDEDYLESEKQYQLEEIKRRRTLVNQVLEQPVTLTDRSVIVTDDGIATGSTLIAGLHSVRRQKPLEIIVSVPVAPLDTLKRIKKHCDEVVCLLSPRDFWAIGQFYRDFRQVSDDEMLAILHEFKTNSKRKPKQDHRQHSQQIEP